MMRHAIYKKIHFAESSSGNLVKFAAIRLASSMVGTLAIWGAGSSPQN
jgi:hypothetical protein